MMYKEGDKVRIRADLMLGASIGGNDVTGEMVKLRGKDATVTGTTSYGEYTIDIDKGMWSWTEGMLEDIKQDSEVLSACEYCEKEKPVLKGTVSHFNDICFFGQKDEDTITFGELRKYFEENSIEVFIDRGHLRLTEGEDTACLDHSIDYVKISYCPVCGRDING